MIIKDLSTDQPSFHNSPCGLDLGHIRFLQGDLFNSRKFSPSTVNQQIAALRFFFVKNQTQALKQY